VVGPTSVIFWKVCFFNEQRGILSNDSHNTR
jgi:hypothetical protein